MELSNKILSDFTAYTKYARYIPRLNRKEVYEETVARVEAMHISKFPDLSADIVRAFKLVAERKVLPSMRAMQFAGKPILLNPARQYNCSYQPANDIIFFPELMFLLLSGTGVGYSVQNRHIKQLPEIRKSRSRRRRFLIGDSIEGWADAVRHLIEGYMGEGHIPIFDYSDIRPKGAMLITSGGKAPGPEPLKNGLEAIESILKKKDDGDKLTSLEVHDICCHIADTVLSGGIRRAAMISLFDSNDQEMLTCKSGEWWIDNVHRSRANNSAVMLRGVTKKSTFDSIYDRCRASNSGEPGFFWTNDLDVGTNPCQPAFAPILKRQGMATMGDVEIGDEIWSETGWTTVVNKWSTGVKPVYRYRTTAGVFYGTENHRVVSSGVKVEAKDAESIDFLSVPSKFSHIIQWGAFEPPYSGFPCKIVSVEYMGDFEVFDITVDNEPHTYWTGGCNVSNCAEIALNANQFCNLTTFNASNVESQLDLEERVWAASFIGTLQASYTDFHYLRPIWKETTEAEALLGVSMTGIADGSVASLDIEAAARVALDVNAHYADILGINKAARVTAIKPEGTSSLVLGTASGVHARHSPYYLRRIRLGKGEGVAKYLLGNHPELVEQDEIKQDGLCFVAPQKSPSGSAIRSESAIELLERVKLFYEKWILAGHRYGNNTHNVSVTVNVKEDEWKAVNQWMWDNRPYYSGISLLPYDGGSYVQAPFEEISAEEYEKRIGGLSAINLMDVVENPDEIANLQSELACSGGACELT